MRNKLSIKFDTPSDLSSSLFSSRGLARNPSQISPNASHNDLYGPLTLNIQDSPSRPDSGLEAPLSDNPETRNHSEVSVMVLIKYKSLIQVA